MGIKEIYSIVSGGGGRGGGEKQTNGNRGENSEHEANREDDEDDHLENTYHKTIYQIPESLTIKIGKMLNAAVQQGHLDDDILNNNEDHLGSLQHQLPLTKRRVSKHDSLVILFILFYKSYFWCFSILIFAKNFKNKSKHNSFSADDIDRPGSSDTVDSDTNSITYHYDFKYGDQSPIVSVFTFNSNNGLERT